MEEVRSCRTNVIIMRRLCISFVLTNVFFKDLGYMDAPTVFYMPFNAGLSTGVVDRQTDATDQSNNSLI